ncbi:MAG: MFS transporter [Acidobacteria bacterium]|nr:MFS transporter [Acidobacteriota bacterium]
MPNASADRLSNTVVSATGLVQGIALVSFPAASSILTGKGGFGLTSSEYGTMFVPQVLAAIAAALLGGRLAGRFGLKRVYLAGVAADLLSMLVLTGSSLIAQDRTVAYVALLLATALLGVGFGLTVPALTTFVAAFHPKAVDRATLVLNALLGLGTALAPVFVAVFVGLGFWWGLPLLVSALLLGLGAIALRLPLRVDAPDPGTAAASAAGIPSRFWLFAAAALLYGTVETMSGNWGQLQITDGLHGSAVQASLALTAFWSMVTVGRIVFAVMQRWIAARWIYRVLPLVIAGAYLGVVLGIGGSAVAGIVSFGLAGLGCSAMLPFTLSFAERQLGSGSGLTGGLIASYQVGYGVAAFGVGPLLAGGVALAGVFGAAAAVAVLLGAGAFMLTARPSRGAT